MPDGDNSNYAERDLVGNYGRQCTLIDNVPSSKATANVYTGPWVSTATIKSATVEVVATGLTGTVNLEGTNVPLPVAATPGNALATPPTGSGFVALSPFPCRWVRARVSGFSAGSVSAYLQGVS